MNSTLSQTDTRTDRHTEWLLELLVGAKNGMVLRVYYCRLSRASGSVYCTYSKMGVDACVPDSSCETLVLPVRNVLMSARISKLFGQTKVYHITQVALV